MGSPCATVLHLYSDLPFTKYRCATYRPFCNANAYSKQLPMQHQLILPPAC